MANTGFKQARIGYKVDRDTGVPLDVNGVRISVSGRRQAIMLLEGTANPSPALYEVQGYFAAREEVRGVPTYIYDPQACPVGILIVTPDRLVLVGVAQELAIISSHGWSIGASTMYVASPAAGAAGDDISVGVAPTAVRGQGWLTVTQNTTGLQRQVYIVSTDDPELWVLDGGQWQDLGFWFDNRLWID